MSGKSYFIRTCYRNEQGQLVSPSSEANGFIWPEEVGAVVYCPDWDSARRCGGGLHGLRPGDYCPGTWATGPNAVWMVCSYDPRTAVILDRKIKVSSCTIEYIVDESDGASVKVPSWLRERGVTEPIYRSEITAAEDYGVAVAGSEGTALAGSYGHAVVICYGGKATAGYYGRAVTDLDGESQAGLCGTAISGSYGTAKAGARGTAIAGIGGKAQAGPEGIIQIYNPKPDYIGVVLVTGYIGENGLEPYTLYQLNEGKFVKA